MQRRWCRLAKKYAMPSGAVGRRCTAILAAELRGVLGRSWKSERPLIFFQVVLTKTLGVHRSKDIRALITRQMDLWERGLHAGLVGDDDAEGAAREGRDASGGEEEDDVLSQIYHYMSLSGKLRKAIRQSINREGGGCILLDDQCTKTGQPVAKVLWEKHPDMRVPPWKIPCSEPSRSMRRCRKRYPSTSRRMTLRGSHQTFLAPRARWYRRRLN